MGEAARLRVIEQFTLRQTIDTFRSIYLELPALARSAASTPRIAAATPATATPAATPAGATSVPAASAPVPAAPGPVPEAPAAVGERPRRPVPSWAKADGPTPEEAGTTAVTSTGSLAG